MLPLLLIGADAGASYSQADISAPGGFISAFAGLQNGSSPWAGSNYATAYSAADLVLNEQTFATGSASASASYSVGDNTNSAQGTVGFGKIAFGASNSASNVDFSAGALNGGWVDSHLFSAPGLAGQAGLWIFTLDISGTMAATGFAGLAQFHVTGYKDGFQLMLNAQFDPGNSDPISTDRQAAQWGLATSAAGESFSRTIDDTVTFAVPFTWGTEFDLGIFAAARAGKRSSSGVPGISTADLDFLHTLTWGGTVGVFANGVEVFDYTQISGSSIDWSVPTAVPVPAMVLPFLFGLGGLLGAARRCS